MTAHVHAALMAEYAKDAAETDEPWKRWQFFYDERGQWVDCNGDTEDRIERWPQWNPRTKYRRKPRTIRIGEFDVPEPMRGYPPQGDTYYFVNFGSICTGDGTCFDRWEGTRIDRQRLQKGICHLTRDAAELHAKALISLTERK